MLIIISTKAKILEAGGIDNMELKPRKPEIVNNPNKSKFKSECNELYPSPSLSFKFGLLKNKREKPYFSKQAANL